MDEETAAQTGPITHPSSCSGGRDTKPISSQSRIYRPTLVKKVCNKCCFSLNLLVITPLPADPLPKGRMLSFFWKHLFPLSQFGFLFAVSEPTRQAEAVCHGEQTELSFCRACGGARHSVGDWAPVTPAQEPDPWAPAGKSRPQLLRVTALNMRGMEIFLSSAGQSRAITRVCGFQQRTCKPNLKIWWWLEKALEL